MKKSVLYVLTIILAISSCSKKNDSEIFDEYFEEWDITIPYQDVSQSETYHLLDALIDNECTWGVRSVFSNSSCGCSLSQTEINNSFLKIEAMTDIFTRKDCVYVLISTYLTSLKTGKHFSIDSNIISCMGNPRDFWFFGLESLLSTDMLISKMKVKEKCQLMVLALEYAKHVEKFSLPISRSFTIMISIMLSSNYTPFVDDIKPMLIEVIPSGYCLRMNDYIAIPGGNEYCDLKANDLIKRYAKQFINDNK